MKALANASVDRSLLFLLGSGASRQDVCPEQFGKRTGERFREGAERRRGVSRRVEHIPGREGMLEASPDHASHLVNYANFLANIRQDYATSSALYKRAQDIDPDGVNKLSF